MFGKKFSHPPFLSDAVLRRCTSTGVSIKFLGPYGKLSLAGLGMSGLKTACLSFPLHITPTIISLSSFNDSLTPRINVRAIMSLPDCMNP